MSRVPSTPQAGFTLFEVIIALVVGSILMALIVPYLGSVLTQSGYSLTQLKTTLSVNSAMENMVADYRNQKANGTLDLAALKASIGAESANQTNSYGTYHVMDNRFILFDGSGNEIAAGATQDILKVTIRAPSGGPFFTTLFARDLP